MTASRFDVIVNTSWCKGCELCIEICPKKVFVLNERLKADPVHIDKCIGCRQCENTCPDMAITVREANENV